MRVNETATEVPGRVSLLLRCASAWLIALPLFALLTLVKSIWEGLATAWMHFSCDMRGGVSGQLHHDRMIPRFWPHLSWFRRTRIILRDIDPPFGRFEEVVGRDEEDRS